MELSYNISKNTYIKFLRSNIKYMKFYELPFERFRIIALFSILIICRILSYDKFVNISIYIIGIFFFIFKKKLVLNRYYGDIKSFFFLKSYLFRNIDIKITEDNFIVSNLDGETKFLWNSILKITIFNNAIIVSTQFMDKIFIPISAFTKENQYNEFIDLLTKYSGVEVEKNNFDVINDMLIENFIYCKDK